MHSQIENGLDGAFLNKTGMSQVGAISKAQKAQKTEKCSRRYEKQRKGAVTDIA